MKFTYTGISFLYAKLRATVALGERLRGYDRPRHFCSSLCPGTTLLICVLIVWDVITELWMGSNKPIDVVGWSFSSVNQPSASVFVASTGCKNHLCEPADASGHGSLSEQNNYSCLLCGLAFFRLIFTLMNKQTHTRARESSLSCKCLIIQAAHGTQMQAKGIFVSKWASTENIKSCADFFKT